MTDLLLRKGWVAPHELVQGRRKALHVQGRAGELLPLALSGAGTQGAPARPRQIIAHSLPNLCQPQAALHLALLLLRQLRPAEQLQQLPRLHLRLLQQRLHLRCTLLLALLLTLLLASRRRHAAQQEAPHLQMKPDS